MKKQQILRLLFLLIPLSPFAQTTEVSNDFESRMNAELKYENETLKKTSFYLEESFRLDEDFTPTKLILGFKVKQKIAPFLSISGRYRLAFLLDDNATQNLFTLSAIINKNYNRLETRYRIRYTNDTDDRQNIDDTFIRFRAMGKYDIPKCKLNPSLAFELFQPTGISSFHKYRTSVGIERKIAKRQYIEFSYKYDYYLDDYKNKHIFALNYSYKL